MKTIDDSAILSALLEAALDAIIISDHTGRIVRINDSAATLFGYLAAELEGQHVRMIMTDDMASRHDAFMRHHVETGEKRIIGIGREVVGRRADGTVFPLHISVGRAVIADATMFVAIMHDQTSKQIAEEAAIRSNRMDAIGQMTGGIAHDFNNLLAVVIGNLELLEMSEQTARNRPLIADALAAAELGADLTSRLVVFSRNSSLEAEVVSLNDSVTQTLAMLKRIIGAHITIDAELADDLWPTRADSTQLQTAVLNLILNAQEAMPNGGRIFLETRNMLLDDSYVAQDTGVEKGRYVRVSISDNGEGMSDETRQRALEPFFTTKASGSGTGLGLSMVYGMVKHSGGHLAIYSEVGEGTTINLYFPALEAGDEQQDVDATYEDALRGFGAGKVILIVEDDPRVMRLSNTRLEGLGFKCLTATTADAAWTILKDRSDIALVFTDLIMPGSLSGHDLAQRIAEQKPGVRVLMTSGFSEGVLRGGRISAEFAILRKPYRQADLVQALRTALQDV